MAILQAPLQDRPQRPAGLDFPITIALALAAPGFVQHRISPVGRRPACLPHHLGPATGEMLTDFGDEHETNMGKPKAPSICKNHAFYMPTKSRSIRTQTRANAQPSRDLIMNFGPDPAPWPHPGPDPDDAPFLALAHAAGAWLVTGNLKHFPESMRGGVQVLSPADYLAHLLDSRKP